MDGRAATHAWPVCRVDDLEVERGATALVHGQAVAIFRTHDDEVYALGNHDPFAKASVLARGIVGTRGDVPFVASPMHKQAFDLRTGSASTTRHARCRRTTSGSSTASCTSGRPGPVTPE